MTTGINEQNAGLFSAAAYTVFNQQVDTSKTPLPNGWSEITSAVAPAPIGNSNPASGYSKDADGFRIFANSDTHQVVIAFKGTDTFTQARNDLTNTGAVDYAKIQLLARGALDNIQRDSAYAGYQIFTDGHSLGGGMAQSFALENGLSGFGQNSLPVAPETITNTNYFPSTADFNTALQNYQAGLVQDSSGNTAHFKEVNVSGDPATFAYSGGAYLDNLPTTLSSPYSAIERAAAPLSMLSSIAGLSLEAWARYKMHSIDTVNSLSNAYGDQTTQTDASGTVTTQYSDGSASATAVHPDNSTTVSTAYPNGSTSVISYDANQNVTSVTVRTFNPVGGTYTVTNSDSSGSCASTTYNTSSNQVISMSSVDGQGTGSTYVYNLDNTSTRTDFSANGPSIIATYDANNNPISSTVTRQDGSSTSERYDSSGNTIFTSATDAAGAATITTIDPATRVWATQYPDGTLSTKTADGYGYSQVSTLRPDGTMAIVTDYYGTVTAATSYADGSGTVTTTSQSGVVTYAATTNPDGSGSTASYNPDGSGTTTSYLADGSNAITGFNGDGSLARVEAAGADGALNITNYGANNVIASTAVSYTDGSGLTTTYYTSGAPQEQWSTNADGTGSHTTYGADGATGSFEVSNADGSGSTGGYNADGGSWVAVRNADRCGGVIFVEAANDAEWRVVA